MTSLRTMQGSLLVVEGNARVVRRQGHARLLETIERVVLPLVENGSLRYTRVPLNSRSDVESARDLARAFAPEFNAVLLLAHPSVPT